MHANQDKDQQLKAALREWTVHSPLPPRFQEQVWRRIAGAEEQSMPSFWPVLTAWVESIFRRPALAVSYVTLLLAAGIMTGLWQVKDKTAESQALWRARYVQSVDPYRMPGN